MRTVQCRWGGSSTAAQDFSAQPLRLVEKLFGPRRDRKVTIAAFVAWLEGARREAAKLEFTLLDTDGSGSLSATELARALVVYGRDARYEQRVALLSPDARFSLADFQRVLELFARIEDVEETLRIFVTREELVTPAQVSGSRKRCHASSCFFAVCSGDQSRVARATSCASDGSALHLL